MNRNEKFFLIMAIVYTVLSGMVIYLIISLGLFNLMGFLIILVAGLCAGSQWLRYRRARDAAKGIVRERKIPKFVPMPDKTETQPQPLPEKEESHGAD